jgi:hypothetical protein
MGIATTTQTKAVKQLSDQNSQGTVLGASSSDLISFYGTTAIAQPVVFGTSTMSTGVSSTGAFGFGTSTTAAIIQNAVAQLQKLGLIN